MRPADGVEKMVRNWSETTRTETDKQVLSDLGRILERKNALQTTHLGRFVAVAASIVVAVLLITHIASRGPAPTTRKHTTSAGIESINAIAISMAYQRGGMDAVDEQYEKAFAGSMHQPDRLSVDTLLNELARDSGS